MPVPEELVIIGAGPAGLAAALAAAPHAPLVLDAGPPLTARSHRHAASVVQGVGGAGLYSDGKFSLWPSASHLWTLDADFLTPAWDRVRSLLTSAGIEFENTAGDLSLGARGPDDRLHEQKIYTSVYGSPEMRLALLESMVREIARPVRTQTEVLTIAPERAGWLVVTGQGHLHAKSVVIATGRLGPMLLEDSPSNLPMFPRRIEVGVRIEQPSSEFFLRDYVQLDPKLIWRPLPHPASALEGRPGVNEEAIEWRTFCCCRNGEVLDTKAAGMITVSGRADCAPTGMSNVGFNVRVTDPDLITAEWAPLRARLASRHGRTVTRLSEFLSPAPSELGDVFGPEFAARLRRGLHLLLRDFPDNNLRTAKLIGPTLEGVGMYPLHDQRLRTRRAGALVAGDATGSFRGLTAALVSGYLAGLSASDDLGALG